MDLVFLRNFFIRKCKLGGQVVWWMLQAKLKEITKCGTIVINLQARICSNDSDCGMFRRSHCKGLQFILCFGETENISEVGKCVRKPCRLGGLLAGQVIINNTYIGLE